MKEVPAHLQEKEPLLASELAFESPPLPEVKVSKEFEITFKSAIASVQELAEKVKRSQRAQNDLKDRKHSIAVKTGGGNFSILIDKGYLKVIPELLKKCDFTMVANDPQIFTNWVNDGSLTDAAVEGTLWLPSKEAFTVLPILDRLPRSIRRDLQK
jgi:hypothetical protein